MIREPARKLAIIGLGISYLLLANNEPREKVRISKTEQIDFPPGGILRLTNSTGEVTVEGWDCPGIEITTVRSTKAAYAAHDRKKATMELERVSVAAAHKSDGVAITTDFPRRGFLISSRLHGASNFELEYYIRVPRDARLVVDHEQGEVNVDNLTGDMDVALFRGQITLHLPEEGQYTINAKCDIGNVNSDFPAPEKRRFWFVGHRAVSEDARAAHKLNLRVGFGDIVILKTRVPKTPEPLTPPEKN